jgi:hypothetical protein
MTNRHGLLLASAALLLTPAFAEPVVKKEIRVENGKNVEYMWIDGIKVHETDPAKQPQPEVVTPPAYDPAKAKPPEGATVLFDGTKDSMEKNWEPVKKDAKPWNLVDGAMESVKRAGYIRTRDEFGSCRLYLEFATPSTVKGEGQGRGNSGVFLMGRYEVQILDSYENTTYPDGQCGAIYGRAVPKVNASRPPGEWQSYDITFHRPIFDDEGKVTRRARFTVIHNGVKIHDDVELWGGTGWRGPHSISEYEAHGDTGPISLQDHGNPVRFRNIWIQPIED